MKIQQPILRLILYRLRNKINKNSNKSDVKFHKNMITITNLSSLDMMMSCVWLADVLAEKFTIFGM